MDRPNKEDYYMNIAEDVSLRSTCLRRQVGAVLVLDDEIKGTGYNGAPRKLEHCSEIGCVRDKQSVPSGERAELCRAVHAEQNAIINAKCSLVGATLYCTNSPCSICAKMLINAGVSTVIFAEHYLDSLARVLLLSADVELVVLGPTLGIVT